MPSTEEWGEGRRERRLQPFASFRYRNYRWLWAANLTSGAVAATKAFLITWLVIEALERNYQLGLINLAGTLPVLLLGLHAGRLADRRDRRLLLMGSHGAVALTLLLIAGLSAGDSLSLLLTYLLVSLGAAATIFGEPVRLALIPAVVPRERILNANALNTLGIGIGAIAGTSLTWALGNGLPIEGAFVILAAVSGIGALFLVPLRVPPRSPDPDGGEATAVHSVPVTVGGGIREGFRFLWKAVELRALFVLLLAAALLGPWLFLDFAAAQDRHDIDVREWALLNLFLGVGIVLSTTVLAFIARVRNAGLLYGLAICVSTLMALPLWFSSSVALVAVLMGLIGLALGFRLLLFQALVHAHTPIPIMGRVMGIYLTLAAVAGLAAPATTRAGRALLDGDGAATFAVVVLAGVSAFVLVRSPGLRRMPSHPELEESPAETASTG